MNRQLRGTGEMEKRYSICLTIAILFCVVCINAKSWTQSYYLSLKNKKKSSITNVSSDECVFTKENILPCTQVIISWNSLRPKHGYFTFWIQAHTQNNQWGKWHKMFHWGADFKTQQSFLSSSDGMTSYEHVRLEAKKDFIDGIKIKVCAHDGADMRNVYGITCSCSNYKTFKVESAKNYEQLESIKLTRVPHQSQFLLRHKDARIMCSPTSLSTFLQHITHKPSNYLTSAEQVYDYGLCIYGSWPFNIAFANDYDKRHRYSVQRLQGFDDIYQRLRQKKPTIVSVRGALQGAPQIYKNGHLIVVVGYDAATKSVICHDPAIKKDNIEIQYPLTSFLCGWESSRRLSYIY
jgi:hypothetical protein